MGFLSRDYGRVADVHFEAGYVPKEYSRDLFMQACRSIGEPILERPLNEISLARLLAQLFRVTETVRHGDATAIAVVAKDHGDDRKVSVAR